METLTGTPSIYVFTDCDFFSSHLQTHLRPAFAVHCAGLKAVYEMSAEARAAFEQEAIAVLVDWRRIDYEILQNVRRRLLGTLQIPLFAVTYNNEAARMATILAEADDYLPPHFSLSLLQLCIEKYQKKMAVQVIPATNGAQLNGHERPLIIEEVGPVPLEHLNDANSATRKRDPIPSAHEVQKIGLLRLDLTARKLYVSRNYVALSRQEFDLLAFLMLHTGACQSRDVLLREVWKYDVDMDCNPIDGAIYRLRKKLQAHGADYITTVYGVGYRLDVDD